MEIKEKKSDLMVRLSQVKDPAVLDEIEKILDWNEESEFDARVAKGLTLEEFRQEMHKRIKSWDWKK